jgi:hypothetical protein
LYLQLAECDIFLERGQSRVIVWRHAIAPDVEARVPRRSTADIVQRSVADLQEWEKEKRKY